MKITIQKDPIRLENIKRFESLWKNKLSWTTLEKISQCQEMRLQVRGNDVISLLWQLRCEHSTVYNNVQTV